MNRVNQSRFHIFDVDKTIIQGSTVQTVLLEGFRRKIFPWSMAAYVPYFFILFTVFGVRPEYFRRVVPPFRGISAESLNTLAREVFDKDFRRRLYPEMVELIQTLQDRGAEVMLASSSFRFILAPFAEHFKIDQVICSELEMAGGVTTGRMKGLPAFQKGKEQRVRDYLRVREIDLDECTFYTDSHRDLSLLRAAGRRVAVNPDRRLLRRALREGWPVLAAGKIEGR